MDTRRRFLTTLGTISVTSLAGCSSLLEEESPEEGEEPAKPDDTDSKEETGESPNPDDTTRETDSKEETNEPTEAELILEGEIPETTQPGNNLTANYTIQNTGNAEGQTTLTLQTQTKNQTLEQKQKITLPPQDEKEGQIQIDLPKNITNTELNNTLQTNNQQQTQQPITGTTQIPYTWEDVKEKDHEHAELKGDTELAQRMLEGENVPGPFNLQEAKNTDINNYEEVKQLLEDVSMSYWTDLAEKRGTRSASSGYSHQAGHTTELVIEELFDKEMEIISNGNEGHGFAYTKVEGHPLSIIDVNVGVGQVNTGHLDGTIHGQDIPGHDTIANFEEERMHQDDRAGRIIWTGTYQNLLGGFYGGEKMTDVGFDIDLLPEIYDDLKDDADQVFNRIKPAIATVHYEIHENSEQYEHPYAVIDADTLGDLPELDTGNFQEYRKELFQNHVDIVTEEEISKRCYNQ